MRWPKAQRLDHVRDADGREAFRVRFKSSHGLGEDAVIKRRGQRTQQNALGFAATGRAHRCHRIPAFGGSQSQFFTHHGRVDAELLCRICSEFVPANQAGHLADVGQQIVDRRHLGIGTARREEDAGAVDQVIRMPACFAQRFSIRADAAFANIPVRVEAVFERHDTHLEAFLGQHRNRFFSRIRAGSIGIKIDDDARDIAAQQTYLVFSESRAAGSEHVGDAGRKDGDAVHLALDQQREILLADGSFCLVQIEEHMTLGIEGRLG